ncbi:MAG: hypothetical protein COU27_03440 [Candidatus Levybacteria bacterium CG10_big_fil_rev_8_21_14_0_10_36_7]|nr:MAG: hypothetical protein COU27_03440 [Candidatus Levybacteria bacterium CG10_big_fil_rev_8_21_14_0_10_36_7]
MNKLNIEQKKAVEHEKGPLLIIAGAGTGKTTVVTERIRYLIVKKHISANNILALTFTDKASFEMQERVDTILPYGYTNLWINTFHSFCDRVLRDEAHSIGLDSGYKLISESESVLMMRQNIFDLGLAQFKPLGNPTKFLDALLSHFSRLKDEDITPDQYIKYSSKLQDRDEKLQYLELSHAYKKYEELKIRESVMDFSDLIANTLLLFRTRPTILSRYRKLFKFILVDEFQDTNYAQNELAILLAGDDKNITVVADDDQSIYRFRGAAVSNVLQFKKTFPKAKILSLTQNYRSSQVILDHAHKLIQHNNPNRLEVVEGINKKLKSASHITNHKIELIREMRADDEADKIAKTILKLTKNKYKYKNIAILVRANNHAQMITGALTRYKIPYQFLGPGYLFQQEEVKDLIAYLTFLTNPYDSVSLFRVLCMDIFSIPYIELNLFLNYAKRNNLTLFEALKNTNHDFLTISTKAQLNVFSKMVNKHIEKSKKIKAGQILYDFIVDSGLFESLKTIQSTKDEKRVKNIAKFFDRIKNFETEKADSTIFTIVEWLTLMLQMNDNPTAADVDMRDENAVNILTVHSSKGLEFDVVFLVNLVSERFPSRERKEKIPLPLQIIKEKIDPTIDFHMEEERRLFYVGMTRAKERLYFTAANYYGAGKRVKKLSPFIHEALPELIEEEKIKQLSHQMTLTEVLAPYQEQPAKEEKITPVKVSYITFSNLQMFDICPLHYKAKVILKLPTPATSVQSFGISIHNTLYQFYKQLQEKNKVSLSQLKQILSKEWKSEGYVNKKDEQDRYLRALSIIENFYKTSYNPRVKPLRLEEPFNFMLKNGVKVFGKIDRVDSKGKGIEIIDYKTGEDNPKAQKAHKLQLEMYALAATRVKDSILNKKPEDIVLSLLFLLENKKKTMTFKTEDLERLENDLIEKIEEIKKSDFKCSKNILCKNCEFKLLCSYGS